MTITYIWLECYGLPNLYSVEFLFLLLMTKYLLILYYYYIMNIHDIWSDFIGGFPFSRGHLNWGSSSLCTSGCVVSQVLDDFTIITLFITPVIILQFASFFLLNSIFWKQRFQNFLQNSFWDIKITVSIINPVKNV